MDATALPTPVSHSLDAGGVLLIVGSAFDFLPKIAVLLAVIWYSVELYGWLEDRIEKRHQEEAKRVAKAASTAATVVATAATVAAEIVIAATAAKETVAAAAVAHEITSATNEAVEQVKSKEPPSVTGV